MHWFIVNVQIEHTIFENQKNMDVTAYVNSSKPTNG